MLSTVAGVSSMGGSERSSDKDLDPQALPFSRAICNGRFHVSSPWEERSFPYVTSPLARRFPCSLQEGDILLKHLTMLSIPFCLGLLMEGGQISYLMGKVRKKLTSQAPFWPGGKALALKRAGLETDFRGPFWQQSLGHRWECRGSLWPSCLSTGGVSWSGLLKPWQQLWCETQRTSGPRSFSSTISLRSPVLGGNVQMLSHRERSYLSLSLLGPKRARCPHLPSSTRGRGLWKGSDAEGFGSCGVWAAEGLSYTPNRVWVWMRGPG